MPPKQKSIEQLEADREKMVDAALDIIIKHGVQALTMNKLAKKFNMSTSNIYNYFESKTDLLLCIRRKGAELFYERVYAAAEQQTDILEKIRAFMEAAAAFGHENREYYDLIITDYTNLSVSNNADDAGKRYEKRPGLRVSDYLTSLISDYLKYESENEIKIMSAFVFIQLHGLIDYNNKSILKRLEVCYTDICNYIFDEIIKELEKRKSEEHS